MIFFIFGLWVGTYSRDYAIITSIQSKSNKTVLAFFSSLSLSSQASLGQGTGLFHSSPPSPSSGSTVQQDSVKIQ